MAVAVSLEAVYTHIYIHISLVREKARDSHYFCAP